MKSVVLIGASMAVAVAGCGGPMTATEYVTELNALVSDATTSLERAIEASSQVEERTMADEVALLEEEIAIRRELLEGFDVLDPPGSLVDIHGIIRGQLARHLAAAEGLAPVAETVSSLDQLLETSEFAEYRAANVDGAGLCVDVQERLDRLADTGQAFAETPWIPGDLALVVRAALGCLEVPAS